MTRLAHSRVRPPGVWVTVWRAGSWLRSVRLGAGREPRQPDSDTARFFSRARAKPHAAFHATVVVWFPGQWPARHHRQHTLSGSAFSARDTSTRHRHRRYTGPDSHTLSHTHTHTQWIVQVPQVWGCPSGRACPHEATAASRASQVHVEPGDGARVLHPLVRRDLRLEHLT